MFAAQRPEASVQKESRTISITRAQRPVSILRTRVHWIKGNSNYLRELPKESRLLHVCPCWNILVLIQRASSQTKESKHGVDDVNDITKGEARLICRFSTSFFSSSTSFSSSSSCTAASPSCRQK